MSKPFFYLILIRLIVKYADCMSAKGGQDPFPKWVSWYDNKPSDGEAQVLEFSLPLLPGPPVVVPSMGQSELFDHFFILETI